MCTYPVLPARVWRAASTRVSRSKMVGAAAREVSGGGLDGVAAGGQGQKDDLMVVASAAVRLQPQLTASTFL